MKKDVTGKRREANGGQTMQKTKGGVSDQDGPCKEVGRGCAATKPYTSRERRITAIGPRTMRKRETVARAPNGCEAKGPRGKKGELNSNQAVQGKPEGGSS